MATRLFLFLLSFYSVYTLFPFEFSKEDVDYRSMYGMGYEIVNQQLIVSKAVTTEIGKPKTRFYEKIDHSDLEMSNDRYFYAMIFKEEKCLIPGSRFLYLFPKVSNDMTIGFQGDFDSSAYIKNTEQEIKKNDRIMGIYYAENLIHKICSSSMLKEGVINYNTSLLNKIALYNGVEHLAWNGDIHPWVEGVNGPGIGEYLTIEFTAPSKDVVILNGFVDPTRRHLYRYNNRVKTAIIRSDDSGEPFEFEHVFEDVVHFDEIRFPRPADKIIFEIKDVYPGDKWDDTCISAILTREPDPYK